MSKAHRTFFNELAAHWQSKTSQESLLDIIAHLGVLADDTVLDIGAGTGCLSHALTRVVQEPGRIVAVDVSDNMLRQARHNLHSRSVLFLCSDACHLAFPQTVFDKIICYSSFPHFMRPLCVLREFYRILKPGGNVLIVHNCCSRKLNHYHAKLNHVVMFDKLPKSEMLEEMFRVSGFVDVKRVERPDLYWVEALKEHYAD